MLGSIIAPLFLGAILMIGTEQLIRASDGIARQVFRWLQGLSHPFSVGVGFYVLTRAFTGLKLRLALAVLYWPFALFALSFWALMLAGGLYGFSP